LLWWIKIVPGFPASIVSINELLSISMILRVVWAYNITARVLT
jgi:hypothetical protein